MFAAILSIAACYMTLESDEKSFVAWMRNTNQLYTGDEYHFRFGVWLSNKKLVQEHNAHKSFHLALNKFAALTQAEYKSLLGRRPASFGSNAKVAQVSIKNAPESIDYREKNVVNTPKDQGACGSCWAFGTVQACESAYALAHGTLNVCSEQNLVDCADGRCSGCNGGMEVDAMEYILKKQDGLLMSEKDYPYKAIETGKCSFDKTKGINKIIKYEHGKEGDETYLRDILAEKGVCDVAIDAGSYSFQLYSGGIYDEPSCSTYLLNHAVGCIGYGVDNGVDYWIVRNSWGASWGESGYIRMSRNKNNQCGIASDALVVFA